MDAVLELLDMAARELEAMGKGDVASEIMDIAAGLKAKDAGEEADEEIDVEEEAEVKE